MNLVGRWGCWLGVGLTCLASLATTALAQTVALPATQDNSIVLLDGEWTLNAGNQGRIRIKGNQHLVAMSFDLTAIRGRRVRRAELVCHAAAETISGVTISTIATPWDEMSSNGLTAGIEGVAGWGYAGARFPAVCGGNAGTLVHAATSPIIEGAYHWEVPPDMVHAMAIGVAHGLAIHEHDADYGRNPTIFSREQSGRAPVLMVELDSDSEPAAEAATRPRLEAIDGTSARVWFEAPSDGFAYEVQVDGVSVGRHNIPLVEPGSTQAVELRDLPPSVVRAGPHDVSIVTLDRIGRRSEAATITGELFVGTGLEFPEPIEPRPILDALSGLSAIPLTDKYDWNGKAVGDLPESYRRHNSIFDGRTVRLQAAAGEVVGFQLLVRGTRATTLEVGFRDWSPRVDLWQALYVVDGGSRIPDPLLPLPSPLPLDAERDQAVVVDIYVPFDSAAGARTGNVRLSDGRELEIELEVLPFALPREASFLCEMNSYGLPDRVEDYYALQRVAYDHRVHCNVLHYSHHTAAPGARKSSLDMRLPSGRRMDNRRYDAIEPGATGAYWDDFIVAFGPFLDGSCFADGHRGPIAAPGFYLTFHESWPLNCREFFNGDPDAYQAFHDAPVYADTYRAIMTDWARTAHRSGWDAAGFQVYFNNKGSLNEPTKAPWILDEPASYWDYRALRYYGELTDQGLADAGSESPRTRYRIDISRPEFCRGQLAGRDDLCVVSSRAFADYRRLVTDRMAHDRIDVWVYGTSNPVATSNRQLIAWGLEAWSHGATGLVPWQTVDKTGDALRSADQLGIFIFDQSNADEIEIRHSLRLKAYRELQQLIEYLELVRRRKGWSQQQMREWVTHYVSLEGDVEQQSEEDAGTVSYDRGSLLATESLRRAAIELLSRPD